MPFCFITGVMHFIMPFYSQDFDQYKNLEIETQPKMNYRMYGIAKLDRRGGEHWSCSLPEEYPIDTWVIRSTNFECQGLNLASVSDLFYRLT